MYYYWGNCDTFGAILDLLEQFGALLGPFMAVLEGFNILIYTGIYDFVYKGLNDFVYTGKNAFVYTGLNDFVYRGRNAVIYTGLNDFYIQA